MCDGKNCPTLLLVLQDFPNAPFFNDIEVIGNFIDDKQIGRTHQRSCDCQSLKLAT